MTKGKKHSRPTLEDALAQPWCYYCEKVYSDVGALLSHQKDKHFQCPCRRRLNTAGGLKVHMAQVHKEELKEVPNALEHRKDPSIEVFTMYGIPEDIMAQRRQEIETEFYREEYERRLRTGNPAPGTAQPGAVKKVKTESAESLKARVAARRAENAARKAAEAAGSPAQSVNSPLQASTPPMSVASTPGPGLPPGMSGPGPGPYGHAPAPGTTNVPNQFTFTAGPNPYNAPPGMTAFPGGGSPISPANAASFARGLSSVSPLPHMQGQFQQPGFNNGFPSNGQQYGYSGAPAVSASPQTVWPPQPASLPSVAVPGTATNGHQGRPTHSADSSDHETLSPKPAPAPSSMSLLKLCGLGLEIVKAKSKDGTDVNTSNGAQMAFSASEIFTAICDRIYSSVTVSLKLSARAEEILRGLLNVGVESSLPASFTHKEKVSNLKESIQTAVASPKATPDASSGKKKDPEKSKLVDHGMSWEEQHSASRGPVNTASAPATVTGPTQDAVTGVVGDGEMGSSVMEG